MKKMLVAVLVFLLLLTMVTATLAEEEDKRYFYAYTSIMGVDPDDSGMLDGGMRHLDYENVSQSDLDQYLALLSSLRFIAFDKSDKDNKQASLMIYNTRFDSFSYLFYKYDSKLLLQVLNENIGILTTESAKTQLDKIAAFVPEMPLDAKGYVLPQFYAIDGNQPTWDGQVSGLSAFDNKKCWLEHYENVSRKTIDQYLMTMYAMGCDLVGNAIELSYDMVPTYEEIALEQDKQTLVILAYSIQEQTAEVVYNPDVSLDLKSGNELIGMFQ